MAMEHACRMIRRFGLTLIVVLLSIFSLIACSATKDGEIAERAVVEFHSQLDSEQYHDVYASADDEFRKTGTEENSVAFLQAVHRKLGKVNQSRLLNYGVGWFAGAGTTVTLAYETEFANGKGIERFVWKVRGDRAVLDGYNINANELVVR